MHGTRLEMMHDHVRAIHRAITGSDPPDSGSTPTEHPALTLEQVAERFAELEAVARSLERIAERVPPFSFAPPLDIINTEKEMIFELGIPGVDRSDVEVEVFGDSLIVSGAVSTSRALDGRVYIRAELPRGPFRRAVRLPEPASGPARIEVENGIVRVRLSKASKSPLPRA
jgi:HSP20 family molecular chaperone IbpA